MFFYPVNTRALILLHLFETFLTYNLLSNLTCKMYHYVDTKTILVLELGKKYSEVKCETTVIIYTAYTY